MNDDFEERLSRLEQRPLPEEWKAQMLAQPTQIERRGPPRWLAVGWGLAWAAVIVLHVSTPQNPAGPSLPSTVDASALQRRAELMQSLLASN